MSHNHAAAGALANPAATELFCSRQRKPPYWAKSTRQAETQVTRRLSGGGVVEEDRRPLWPRSKLPTHRHCSITSI